MRTLTGNVALVTGAGSGIGRANSVVMAARGAAIIVNDLNGTGAEETVALIREAGGVAVACIADVSHAASVEQAFTAAQKELGAVDSREQRGHPRRHAGLRGHRRSRHRSHV